MTFPFYLGILENPDIATQPVDSGVGLEQGGYTGSLAQVISTEYDAIGDWRLKGNLVDDTLYNMELNGINNPVIHSNYLLLSGSNYVEGTNALIYDSVDKWSVYGAFKKDNDNITYPYETIVSKSGISSDDSFAVILDSDSRKLALFVSDNGTNVEAGTIDLELNDLSVYIYFCFTFDTGQIKGYINGVEQNILRW